MVYLHMYIFLYFADKHVLKIKKLFYAGAIDVALGAGAAGAYTNCDATWDLLLKVCEIYLLVFVLIP